MKHIFLTISALFLITICGTAQTTKSGSTEVSASALKKLDPQLILALKQQRGESPFNKPTSLQPSIPIRDGDRVLVDITATVSEPLRNHITGIGGQLTASPDPDHIIRAMMPLIQLEALSGRADVKSIAPGQLSVTRGLKLESH